MNRLGGAEGVASESGLGGATPADVDQDPNIAEAEDVKSVALKSGGDVVGIAPADRWDAYVPEGCRPYDILPEAKSVIVVGCRGPSAGAWLSPDHRIMEVNGYDFANDRAVHGIADHIERKYGYYAIQAPALPTGGHQPPMSMMLSAVLSGLGTRSFAANIILNPKYGLLYYSACITTMPLPVDPMLEQDVCPHPMCVATYKKIGKTPCMAACPADEGGCLDGKIGEDGRIEESYYNRERCVSRAMNFGINSFQKYLEKIVNEDDSEKRSQMVYSDFFSRSCSALSFYKESVAQCFECMRVCPIGRDERKLK
jgi:epoxyqueuosine reductase QueG